MEAEERTKIAAELKQWIAERINELQAEIEKLKELESFVDSYLKQATFRPAAEYTVSEVPEVREIKRDKTGETIARATITSQYVIVEPAEGVNLKVETSPFRSFFVGKVLEKERRKDEELASSGQIEKGKEIKFNIEERNGIITRIRIENYRERSRLNEILSALKWTFSRMLEK